MADPYNPSIHNSQDPTVNPLISAKSGHIALLAEISPPTYWENIGIVSAENVIGGNMSVTYYPQLFVRSGAGIKERVVKEGMEVYVKYAADGTPLQETFKLIQLPGNQPEHWEVQGSPTVQPLSKIVPVLDLTARDAIAVNDREFVSVYDARTAQQVLDGDHLFSRT